MSTKIHFAGRYLYKARIGVRVHASRCGGTNSLHAPVIRLANNVTCARCRASLSADLNTAVTSHETKGG